MKANVRAVLLAAGKSTRMGAANKLLLPYGGVAMIRHMTATYRAATGAPVLVVTGHEADQIEEALQGTDALTVFNADYEQGQQTSVALGLRMVNDADAVLIGLGDQPLLKPADLTSLMAAHFESGGAKISVPMQGDRRGNPIIIPSSLRARVLSDPSGPGCKKFTRTHLEHVQPIAVTRTSFFTDVDTPQAYAAVCSDQLGITS